MAYLVDMVDVGPVHHEHGSDFGVAGRTRVCERGPLLIVLNVGVCAQKDVYTGKTAATRYTQVTAHPTIRVRQPEEGKRCVVHTSACLQ
jgi:hypothetical protein